MSDPSDPAHCPRRSSTPFRSRSSTATGESALPAASDLGGIAGHLPDALDGQCLFDLVHPARPRRRARPLRRRARPRRAHRRGRTPASAAPKGAYRDVAFVFHDDARLLRRARVVPRRHRPRHGRRGACARPRCTARSSSTPGRCSQCSSSTAAAVPQPGRHRHVRGRVPRTSASSRRSPTSSIPTTSSLSHAPGSPKRSPRRAGASRATSASAAATMADRCKVVLVNLVEDPGGARHRRRRHRRHRAARPRAPGAARSAHGRRQPRAAERPPDALRCRASIAPGVR